MTAQPSPRRIAVGRAVLAMAVLATSVTPAGAQTGTAPSATAAASAVLPPSLLTLSSSASAEVPRDLLSITLSTSREGLDAGAVQTQLRQALDAALQEARAAQRPGQLEVQTGNFALQPRYAKDGAINGWRGAIELVIEGRDLPAIGQLVGRIRSLTVQRVAYGLSRELREQTEAQLATQAIARFRARADDHARQFGAAGYAVHEVRVDTSEATPPPRPYNAAMAMARAEPANEALPVEPGKGTVTVSVSGSVRLR